MATRKEAPAPAPAPVVATEVALAPPAEALPISRTYQLKKQFMQKVQGDKEHPTWKAVLDALHQLGLKSIETSIVQIPNAENGNTAIMSARITMEDGSHFDSIGLASPENVPNKMISKHMLHMAETRAKGRAGRDAINVGEALLEEMADTPVRTNTFQPQRSPVLDAIDAVWAGTDQERKNRVRQYIVNNLDSQFGENVPTISSLADVKALPESYLELALKQ